MIPPSGSAFRIACYAVGAIWILPLLWALGSRNPLKNLTIPSIQIANPGSQTEANPPADGKGKSGPPTTSVPPEIQARIDRIVKSEILGPLPKPQPLMLLGLAGGKAILQTPTGQTGLAGVGDELGGVKVLRITTNRVLVEHQGKKKELMIHNGLGSETLLPQEKK